MTKKLFVKVTILFMVLSSQAFAMMGSMGGGSNHMDNRQTEQHMTTQQHDQHMVDQSSYHTPQSSQSGHQDMAQPGNNPGATNHEYMDHETMDDSGVHNTDAENFFND